MNLRMEIFAPAAVRIVPALAAVAAIASLSSHRAPYVIVAAALGLLIAIALFLVVRPSTMMNTYFVALCFEGVAKIWSDYNPIVRVAADGLLVLAFARLVLEAERPADLRGDGAEDATTRIAGGMIFVYWLWVCVQFFNPAGLGLVPALSSFKVYVVPILPFFAARFYMQRNEVLTSLGIIASLCVVHGIAALVDWGQGDQFMLSLHPRYASTVGAAFLGVNYRPFGLTALPGGPSAWMFHGIMAVLVGLYLFHREVKDRVANFIMSVCCVLIPLGLGVELVCQIRTTIVRTVLLIAVAAALAWRQLFRPTMLVPILVVLYFGGQFLANMATNPQFSTITKRFSSLGSANTFQNARSGALDRADALADKTTLGIGLGRTGAMSAPWSDLGAVEPVYGNRFNFTDNVFLAVFTELGIFGLLAYVTLNLFLIGALLSRRTYLRWTTAAYAFLMFASGYGSEGIMYQPDASCFWFFIGVAFRFDGGKQHA